jgi:hypothetical protein
VALPVAAPGPPAAFDAVVPAAAVPLFAPVEEEVPAPADQPRRGPAPAPPREAPRLPEVSAPVANPASVATPVQARPAPEATAGAEAPPLSEQLTQAFVAHATVVSRDGRTDFHLRLEPPSLGTVHVYLSATEHTVSARLVVAHEGTQALLEAQAQNLRESLAQAGIALGGFDVTRGGGGDPGPWQQPRQQPPAPATPDGAVARPDSGPGPAPLPGGAGIDLLA